MADALCAKLDEYQAFLENKTLIHTPTGMVVDAVHQGLFDFQADIVKWALRRGRAAIFADCGLGKTLMQLEWARHVGGVVLIMAPLSVAEQTMREAGKLGLNVRYARHRSELVPGINITNYEMCHEFIPEGLDGMVLDESSILKSVDGKTRTFLLKNFVGVPFKLCCTATPCPNDISEIANHAEFLEVLTRQEMLAAFFVHDEEGWRLRRHAIKPFYRWMASWAMALRSPADLGYDASRFQLPDLNIRDEIINTEWRRGGMLFPGNLKGIQDRSAVRKDSVADRVARAAELANHAEGQIIVWCGLNSESEAVTKAIPGSIEVRGEQSREDKIAAIQGFLSGQYRVLVTKPKIAGFGMNFQNAHTMIFVGLSDSYETYYQCIRRCWRYGQTKPVNVHVVVTDHEREVVENIREKERHADKLTSEIVACAAEYEREELHLSRKAESLTTATYSGDAWELYQGDCVDTMRGLPDASVDMSVFSPPFLALYTYSSTERDMGNSRTPTEFFQHFGFAIKELLRITAPGRLACVHVAQVPTTKQNHGYIGLQDFRADTVKHFVDGGWIYHGEVVIDKDPQAQAIRTKSKALLFVQLRKDSSWLRPALADYILVFRKPGDNRRPINPDISNEDWIEWARPIWYGIKETDTLNVAEGRGEEDERHICPLQLGTIERCIRLWSNPGDTVFSPFAGIGSEGYMAVKLGRRFVGCELKDLYAKVAARNIASAERQQQQPTLFSGALVNA